MKSGGSRRARTEVPGQGKKKGRLPSDIADAAEIALDDMLVQDDDDDALATATREPRSTDTNERTAARKPAPEPIKDETRRVASPPPPRKRAQSALPALRFAIFEDAPHLATAQAAITGCGHVCAIAAGGRNGAARVVEVIRDGSIDAVIAALPGGEPVIEAARCLEPHRPIVLAALSGNALDATRAAVAAGADLVTTRPHDVERLAPILLAAARLRFEQRAVIAARGSERVLRARLDEIADAEPRGLLPFEMFQHVLEIEIRRAKRFEYPLSVALFAVEIAPPPPPPGIRGILRARAGNVLVHTIRDIDIATQLDHERFLVLLPYTDLKGSAGLGRRVIAAVAAGAPVVAGGRSFPPRVVGAVAGAQPGQAVSFAKLVKDATRALDQARRDGAELAVQP